MAGHVTTRAKVVKVREGAARWTRDTLAGEEPLEIRVNSEPITVTMRTPGDDFSLALGFCLSEGIIEDASGVAEIRSCADREEVGQPTFNVVDIALRDPSPVSSDLRRNVTTSSACGVCGATSIQAVRRRAAPVASDATRLSVDVLSELPDRLREAQAVFDATGGLHAAALFTAGGQLLAVREDVGRHNALDKLVGWAATERLRPAAGSVLLVSGRVAFEIVQKALVLGSPILAAVSAPSSLAVDLAEETGLTLVGFLRGSAMNVYSAAWRLDGPDGEPLGSPPAPAVAGAEIGGAYTSTRST